MTRPIVIAIDGPAAAGKGTLARRLAAHFGLTYLDTGLLYRSIGAIMAERGLDPDDSAAASSVAETLTPQDLERGDLRGREAGDLASRVAVHPGVRSALVAFQRRIAADPRGAVLDGRDIGTVICPDADVKLFVTASPEVRARRRTDELLASGGTADYEAILADVRARDRRDSERTEAPLKAADDAATIDTSDLDPDQAFARAIVLIGAATGG